MKLIVGLGNPGEKYKNNRHNVGFMFVDYLLEMQKLKIKNQNGNVKFKINKYLLSEVVELNKIQDSGFRIQNFVLAKPQTFMNESGIAVKKLIENCMPAEALAKAGKLKIGNLIIVHDDLDIPLETFHIQKGVGPKLHNGLASIEQYLKTKDFWRIRIGVDNRDPEKRIDGEVYVLQDFLSAEKDILQNTIFPKILSFFIKKFTE